MFPCQYRIFGATVGQRQLQPRGYRILSSMTTNMSNSLHKFNIFGWKPSDELSEDENFMDLVLLVTRSSKLRQGGMACILARAPVCNIEELNPTTVVASTSMMSRIVSVATNQALYKDNESDIHAEVAAIGQAARLGLSTDHCTAYITMPPCRKCFAALLCAGIRRIVSRHASPLTDLAAQHNVQMLVVDTTTEQRARVDGIVLAYEEDQAQRRQLLELHEDKA